MLRPSLLLGLALIWTGSEGFYLPGLAPVTYCDKPSAGGQCTVISLKLSFKLKKDHFRLKFRLLLQLQDDIKLYVNRLNSEESVIPYEYEQ